MSRNKDRVNQNIPPQAIPELTQNVAQAAEPMSGFNFIVPTEVVDLPSKGKYYPEGHPLKGVDSIEIRHMTAKEEDILTSQSLIKKGVLLSKHSLFYFQHLIRYLLIKIRFNNRCPPASSI